MRHSLNTLTAKHETYFCMCIICFNYFELKLTDELFFFHLILF